jgi:hypothetical protein
MGLPASFPTTFTVPNDADPYNVAIKAAPRGNIQQLRVIQRTGDAAGFSYALFAARRALPEDGTLADDAELYRVTKDYAVAPGEMITADEDGFGGGQAYRNMDGSPSNLKGLLYMRLTGGGGKTFSVSLLVDVAVAGA